MANTDETAIPDDKSFPSSVVIENTSLDVGYRNREDHTTVLLRECHSLLLPDDKNQDVLTYFTRAGSLKQESVAAKGSVKPALVGRVLNSLDENEESANISRAGKMKRICFVLIVIFVFASTVFTAKNLCMQTYKINGEMTIHLNPRPQLKDIKPTKLRSGAECEGCGGHIHDFPNQFCSIACKQPCRLSLVLLHCDVEKITDTSPVKEDTGRRKRKKLTINRVQMTEDELILHFFQFDEGGQGSITLQDLRRVAAAHDFTWSDKEMAYMIQI
ncbi:hypothetical protein POM88_046040 [Heracleum sosnowskyi]|uniref:EF-hand domain-containing protein n=1 Tax=Heracleum sosnowskyi TaxID=360622 RepID=A0AAD8H736_9APIA|nr:hypothetical protein POM88_046040 [Heracleum sosnowskyi]